MKRQILTRKRRGPNRCVLILLCKNQQRHLFYPVVIYFQVRMIHLRRYINELQESVKEKEYQVQRLREEFRKCNERVEILEKERKHTERDIKASEESDNV